MGEEQWFFIDSCPAEWSRLPIPDGPLTVGIDGGYVKAQGEHGWFEVIAGKSLLAFHRGEEAQAPVSSKCFAFVQTYDPKPKRRLFEVLQSQGHQLNQQITFLSDGGDTVRDLQLYLNPQAEHLLDWFHVTMRLTVMQQTAKSLPETTRDEEVTYEVRAPVIRSPERLKWFLWPGNVYQAFQVIQSVEGDLEVAVATSSDSTARKLLKAVEEFYTYIERNQAFIPNYGEMTSGRRRSARGIQGSGHTPCPRPRDQCRLAAQRLTHAYPTVQYATDVPRVAARPVLSIRTMIPIRYNNSTVGPREPCQNTTVPPTVTSLTAMRCAGCSVSSTINTLRTGHTGISNTQTRQLFARHRVVAILVCDIIAPGF